MRNKLKRAQNRRCTFSICEQPLGKVLMKRNETFRSYRLHKHGTPKMLRTDRRSRPTARPAFAKATQEKIEQHHGKSYVKVTTPYHAMSHLNVFRILSKPFSNINMWCLKMSKKNICYLYVAAIVKSVSRDHRLSSLGKFHDAKR